ncbi:MAG TPA: hypothetical protein PKD10_03415 [Paracoccaceae bacterium]|nr:hypothetical protein [Paracoccaceae bacterium]
MLSDRPGRGAVSFSTGWIISTPMQSAATDVVAASAWREVRVFSMASTPVRNPVPCGRT